MKKQITALFLFLFVFQILYAQESIGFTDHTDITALEQYRLPDWGYSVFSIDLSSNGSFVDGNYAVGNFKTRAAGVSLAPDYLFFRESEERSFTVNSRAAVNGAYNRTKDERPFTSMSDRRRTEIHGNIFTSVDYANYFSNNRFTFLEGSGSFSHSREKEEEKDQYINWQTGEIGQLIVRTGLGVGRIRNVTPVIRALRFRERALTLGRGEDIDAEQIHHLAQHIAKEFGYQRVYFRYPRYFMGDLFSIVEPVTGDLSAYEMYYLTDVFQEATGVRLEGWNLRAGLLYNMQYSFSRSETDDIPADQITKFTHKVVRHHIGPELSASFFRNISLRQQIGIQSSVSYGFQYRLDRRDETIRDRQMIVHIMPSWLWNVADRLLLRTEFRNDFYVNWYDEARQIHNNRDTRRWHHLLFSAHYFIEDRLVLSGTATYSYQNPIISNMTSSSHALWYGVGLTYYFFNRLR